ncbi:hypothetical protein MY04_3855 [Flammeovirga sp. MY04]|uniref:helix-turn-helix domain-containing transcriptional regulator n=1 Tax=Flammeovirga sp. MY04 TaxID=1191459 RepID=UPI00080633E2|nr:hypothetical protein [Flammeovirga sp. MY04]ANQ51199.1 hypothetical protein MY04_3855 [Flammeovirga sp. MY04]
MMKTEVTPYKSHEQISNVKTAIYMLRYAMAEGDSIDIIHAVETLVKYIGVKKVSELTGLHKNSLYKTISGKTSPKIETIIKIIRAIEAETNMKTIEV